MRSTFNLALLMLSLTSLSAGATVFTPMCHSKDSGSEGGYMRGGTYGGGGSGNSSANLGDGSSGGNSNTSTGTVTTTPVAVLPGSGSSNGGTTNGITTTPVTVGGTTGTTTDNGSDTPSVKTNAQAKLLIKAFKASVTKDPHGHQSNQFSKMLALIKKHPGTSCAASGASSGMTCTLPSGKTKAFSALDASKVKVAMAKVQPKKVAAPVSADQYMNQNAALIQTQTVQQTAFVDASSRSPASVSIGYDTGVSGASH